MQSGDEIDGGESGAGSGGASYAGRSARGSDGGRGAARSDASLVTDPPARPRLRADVDGERVYRVESEALEHADAFD